MMRARYQGLGRLIFILGLVKGDYATSLDNVNTTASPNAEQISIRGRLRNHRISPEKLDGFVARAYHIQPVMSGW